MGSWADIPADILEFIAEEMDHQDFFNFGAVCDPWRSVYLENKGRIPKKLPISLCLPRPFGVPLLLLSATEATRFRDFVSLAEDETAHCGWTCGLDLNDKWICGSSYGWLVALDMHGEGIELVNPLKNARIKLPSRAAFTRNVNYEFGNTDTAPDDFRYVEKAILSSDPTANPGDCIIMAIVGCHGILSFCRIGDNKWTNVKGSPFQVHDVICHEGRFYAVNQAGVMLSFDAADPCTGVTYVSVPPVERGWDPTSWYLVASSRTILQIGRTLRLYDDEEGSNEDESECNEGDIDEDDRNEDESERDDIEEEDGKEDGNSQQPESKFVLEQIETIRFEVYKLNKRESPFDGFVPMCNTINGLRQPKKVWYDWVKVESLGDRIVFLGNTGSVSLPVQHCPGNRIYFTDDDFDRHFQVLRSSVKPAQVLHDVGFYDLEEGKVHLYHPSSPCGTMPAVWVMANPL